MPRPHFPDRLHADVWRNWQLVPTARLAKVVGATPAQIHALGEALGLARPPRINDAQSERSRLTQDKGHRGEWEAFAKMLREGGSPPIAFEEIASVSLATLRAIASRQTGEAMIVDTEAFLAAALSPENPPQGSSSA